MFEEERQRRTRITPWNFK